MITLRKHIAYAYPTSEHAEELGSHGYYIAQSRYREDGSWSPPYLAQGCSDVFTDINDPDLIALLGEADGEYYLPHCQSTSTRDASVRSSK